MSSDGKHILTSFGDLDTSLAVTYNLFADKLLSTNLISSNVRFTTFVAARLQLILSLQLYNAQTESLQSVVSGSSGQCALSFCYCTSLSFFCSRPPYRPESLGPGQYRYVLLSSALFYR